MRVLRVLTLLALALALAAVPAGAARKRGLTKFRSCPQLLDYARSHGTKAVGTGWVPEPMTLDGPRPSRVPTGNAKGGPVAPTAAEDSAGAPGESGAGTTFSTTNVQEEG